MSSTSSRFRLTGRDRAILAALSMSPLTARQVYQYSQIWRQPFASDRRVRERLARLSEAGLIHCDRYRGLPEGSPNYYRLAPRGFRVLYGPHSRPPRKRFFAPVGLSRQEHTHRLAEFIIHTAVAAGRAGIALTDFTAENTVRLPVGGHILTPDCTFRLGAGEGRRYGFLVELDNCSHRLRSELHPESWQQKLRLYDAYQDHCRHRFRLLLVTTGGQRRLDHILELAAEVTRNPRRSLVYGIRLADYLTAHEPLTAACFRDHQARPRALLPRK